MKILAESRSCAVRRGAYRESMIFVAPDTVVYCRLGLAREADCYVSLYFPERILRDELVSSLLGPMR